MKKMKPGYQMKLIDDIEKTIWEKYSSYKKVELYIKKWHCCIESNYRTGEEFYNFDFIYINNNIDLLSTLHNIDEEILIKIAIDLGIETPDFIPSIPTFRNLVKSEYKVASELFEKAFQQIEGHPDIAVGLANSALESIIKEILKDESINSKIKGTETLYKLASIILKEFNITNKNHPIEIKTIGSSLLAICQSVEKLRSEKTNFHGKTDGDYLLTESIYTYFVINAISTVGLYLNSYFKTKFPKQIIEEEDIPF